MNASSSGMLQAIITGTSLNIWFLKSSVFRPSTKSSARSRRLRGAWPVRPWRCRLSIWFSWPSKVCKVHAPCSASETSTFSSYQLLILNPSKLMSQSRLFYQFFVIFHSLGVLLRIVLTYSRASACIIRGAVQIVCKREQKGSMLWQNQICWLSAQMKPADTRN